MNQTAIKFNPPPEPCLLKFEHGSQNRTIYELLYRGGANAGNTIAPDKTGKSGVSKALIGV